MLSHHCPKTSAAFIRIVINGRNLIRNFLSILIHPTFNSIGYVIKTEDVKISKFDFFAVEYYDRSV